VVRDGGDWLRRAVTHDASAAGSGRPPRAGLGVRPSFAAAHLEPALALLLGTTPSLLRLVDSDEKIDVLQNA
jgi:hypothetical protein